MYLPSFNHRSISKHPVILEIDSFPRIDDPIFVWFFSFFFLFRNRLAWCQDNIVKFTRDGRIFPHNKFRNFISSRRNCFQEQNVLKLSTEMQVTISHDNFNFFWSQWLKILTSSISKKDRRGRLLSLCHRIIKKIRFDITDSSKKRRIDYVKLSILIKDYKTIWSKQRIYLIKE